MGTRKVHELFGMELLLAQFLNNSTIGLAIVDEQLRYRAVNTRLAEMNGIPIECHLGKTLREVLGEVALQAERSIKRVFATGEPVFNLVLAGTIPARAGPTRFVDHLLPLIDRRGRVKHVGAVAVELEPTTKVEPVDSVRVPESSPPVREILRSWKEIADYVGACVKTVQRWEHQYNFPVRRLERSKGAVVFALKAEVDSWIEMRTTHVS